MLTEPRLFQLIGVITYNRKCDDGNAELVECEFSDEFEALNADHANKKAKKIIRFNAKKMLKLEKQLLIGPPEGRADLYEICHLRGTSITFTTRKTKRKGEKAAGPL